MNTFILIRDLNDLPHLINPRHVVRIDTDVRETSFITFIRMVDKTSIATGYGLQELARILQGLEGGY